MSNQITISEFRNNFAHYQERMNNGECFTFLDYEETKHELMEPVGDKGLPIHVVKVKV